MENSGFYQCMTFPCFNVILMLGTIDVTILCMATSVFLGCVLPHWSQLGCLASGKL